MPNIFLLTLPAEELKEIWSLDLFTDLGSHDGVESTFKLKQKTTFGLFLSEVSRSTCKILNPEGKHISYLIYSIKLFLLYDLMTSLHNDKLQVFKLTRAQARSTACNLEGVNCIPVTKKKYPWAGNGTFIKNLRKFVHLLE